MFFRILANSFRRSRRRKTVAFVALAIASAMWTLVLAVGSGIGDRARRDLTAYGANIVVRPETAEAAPSILGAPLPAPPSPQALPEAALDAFPDLFWKNNITAISPVLDFAAEVEGRKIAAEGVDFRRERRSAKGETISTGILGVTTRPNPNGRQSQAPCLAPIPSSTLMRFAEPMVFIFFMAVRPPKAALPRRQS